MAPRTHDLTRDAGEVLGGRRPVIELLRSGAPLSSIYIATGLQMKGIVGEIRSLAQAAGVPVRVVPRTEIEKMASGQNHQGVAAEAGRFRYTPLNDILRARASVLFLDGVTDPHNVGSLLRSADCAGFGGVVLPAHGSAGVTPAVRRVSAGAAEVVPVARVASLPPALEEARRADLWVVGLDAEGGDDVWDSNLLDPPVALVLGSEGKGIRPGVRSKLDGMVRIPQGGRISSLNVAVAGAIAMFEVTRRMDRGSDTL